jgi:hypothetical protein
MFLNNTSTKYIWNGRDQVEMSCYAYNKSCVKCKYTGRYGPNNCKDFCKRHWENFKTCIPAADALRNDPLSYGYFQESSMEKTRYKFASLYMHKSNSYQFVYQYELMKRVESKSATLIQAHWKRVMVRNRISDPNHPLGKARLEREFIMYF